MENAPLVSIPVITYNSSDYIIDGLESIKSQTYKNIELIISDDCSTDNTVDVCRSWIDQNKQYFKRVKLVTTDQNTGVAGNLNRALRECKGEWIKTLSGDDKFLPNTIEEYIKYITQNPSCKIAFAKLNFYGESESLVNETKNTYERDFYPKIKAPYKTQFRENLIKLFLPGPGIFYKKALWEEIEGYDENYPFCEEIPFTTKILDLGERIYFIDKELYRYHVREGSISKTKSRVYITLRKNIISYFKDVKRSKMIKNGLILQALDQTISFNLEEAKQENLKINIIIFSILKYFSPLRYINFLKKHTGKRQYHD